MNPSNKNKSGPKRGLRRNGNRGLKAKLSGQRVDTPRAQALSVLHPRAKMELREFELKIFDTAIALGTTLANTNVPGDVTGIAQGVGANQRVGDSATIKGLSIDVTCAAGAAVAGNGVVRFIVFQWLDDSAVTTPTAALVLQTVNTTSPYLASAWRQDDLRILHDERKCFENVALNASQLTFSFELAEDLGSIMFSSGGTAGRGKIYFLIFCDTATTPSTYGLYARFLYIDP
jgi:hypothetical protein